jgi:hypothetical protein
MKPSCNHKAIGYFIAELFFRRSTAARPQLPGLCRRSAVGVSGALRGDLERASATRAVASGAALIERVDLLVKLASVGAPDAEIDRTVEIVDQKLNEKIVQGGRIGANRGYRRRSTSYGNALLLQIFCDQVKRNSLIELGYILGVRCMMKAEKVQLNREAWRSGRA